MERHGGKEMLIKLKECFVKGPPGKNGSFGNFGSLGSPKGVLPPAKI